MLCSKCKVFNIHIPNYDCNICEFGHVVCRNCGAKDKNCCGICGGHIIRRTELRLEGTARTLIRKPGDFSNSKKRNTKKEKDPENCVNLFDSKRQEGSEEGVRLDLEKHLDSDDITSSELNRTMNIFDSIIERDSGYKLQTPSNATTRIVQHSLAGTNSSLSLPNSIINDSNKASRPIQEFHKHSNLEYFTDSSSKKNLDSDSFGLSDSSTSAQHLPEIRNVTNNILPTKVSGYEVQDTKTMPEAATVTTCKTQKEPTMDSCTLVNGQDNNPIKIDVSTTMKKKSKMQDSNTVDSISNTENIREKLKRQIYSQFRKESQTSKNAFIIKGDISDLPPHSVQFDASAATKDNKLAEAINNELEKALNSLNILPYTLHQGNQRRAELAKQSRNALRQKLVEEIYSPFSKDIRPWTGNKDEVDSSEQKEKNANEMQSENYKNIISVGLAGNPAKVTRTLGLSTESYPKLSQDLDGLSSHTNKYVNTKFSFEDAYINEKSVFTLSDPSGASFRASLAMEPPWSPFTSQSNDSPDNERVIKVNSLMHPIPVLPSSSHAFSEKKESNFSRCDPLYDIPEDDADSEEYIASNKIIADVFYCNPIDENPFSPNNNSGNDCIYDYREEPKKHQVIKDIRRLMEYIRNQYPRLSVKDLRGIIMNLPEQNSGLTELGPNMYAPPSFQLEPETNVLNDNQHMLEASKASIDVSCKYRVTALRAFCMPFSNDFERYPQFRAINPFDLDGAYAIASSSFAETPVASDLNISRSPVICPISSCGKLIFVSEFSRHIKIDHIRIPVESMTPGTCKSFFFDTRTNHYCTNKCHVMYLVTNKIRDMGSKEFKDYLPILVMSTKISLLEIISPGVRDGKDDINFNDKFLMLWLTGDNPSNLPIYYSVIAWSRQKNIPKCHIVHSGLIYSVRNNQDHRSVFNSGQALLLSPNQCKLLTQNDQNLIELQVLVH